jgi:hypothetical protein
MSAAHPRSGGRPGRHRRYPAASSALPGAHLRPRAPTPATVPSSAPSAELPELAVLQRIVQEGGADLQQRVVGEADAAERRFPLTCVMLGNPAPGLPAVGFFGGVHGLERIGAEVVLAFLQSLVVRLRWDTLLRRLLESLRLVFMPVVNPGGLWRGTRANPNGVDLMRNAPLDADERVPFLVGGQRLSASLPWYRGADGAPMQAESAALCRVVEDELLAGRPFAIAVDCHSGFGLRDRLWFPFAHSRRPMEHLPEMHALCELFEQANAHHPYVFEPQSRQYLAHGDLWDHLYLRACRAAPARGFLPLTLEMGSWLWVKKNPRQLLSRHGLFNPLIDHRQQRVLRRHLPWFDFVARAAASHAGWMPRGAERAQRRRQALARWYGSAPA